MIVAPYIAIDPGRSAGWASFDASGKLLGCGLAKPPFTSIPTTVFRNVALGPSPVLIEGPWSLLVIEKPHGGESRASRSDLVKLSRRMQMIVDLLRPMRVLEVAPSRWKHSVRKLTMTRRIRNEWLTPDDVAVLEGIRASKNHNVIDAVGLGIWYAAANDLRRIP